MIWWMILALFLAWLSGVGAAIEDYEGPTVIGKLFSLLCWAGSFAILLWQVPL